MNVAEFLRSAAESAAEQPAIIEDDRVVTYRELWRETERTAGGLGAIGIRPGSRAAVLLGNRHEFVSSLLALLSINAVAVPVKPQTDILDLTRMLENSTPEALITSARVLRQLLSQAPHLIRDRAIILVPDSAGEERLLDPEGILEDSRLFHFSEVAEMGASHAPSLPLPPTSAQLASINYTYRGYGYPLGAMLTHHNYIDAALRYVDFFRIREGERILLSLPAAHIFPLVGCIFVSLAAKGTLVLPRSVTPRSIFDAIERHRVQLVTLVPTLYEFLAKHYRPEKWDLSSVELGVCGGECLPERFHERMAEKFPFEIVEGYGLTETAGLTANPPGANRPGTLGVPARGVRLRIVDANGVECPAGETGEIVAQCDAVMAGYHRAPAETEEAIREGWFYTGDYGSLDEEGYLHFRGLRKAIRKLNGITLDAEGIPFPSETLSSAPPGVCSHAPIAERTPPPASGRPVAGRPTP